MTAGRAISDSRRAGPRGAAAARPGHDRRSCLCGVARATLAGVVHAEVVSVHVEHAHRAVLRFVVGLSTHASFSPLVRVESLHQSHYGSDEVQRPPQGRLYPPGSTAVKQVREGIDGELKLCFGVNRAHPLDGGFDVMPKLAYGHRGVHLERLSRAVLTGIVKRDRRIWGQRTRLVGGIEAVRRGEADPGFRTVGLSG